jgi:hypothetical protein
MLEGCRSKYQELFNKWSSASEGIAVEKQQRVHSLDQRITELERLVLVAKDEGDDSYDSLGRNLRQLQSELAALKEHRAEAEARRQARCEEVRKSVRGDLSALAKDYAEVTHSQLRGLAGEVERKAIKDAQQGSS